MKKKHLQLDMDEQAASGDSRHPQIVMKELGITYQHAVPQSVADCWQFFNCENIPKQLPRWIEEIKVDPMELIGWGLDKETAEKIKANET